MGLPGSRSSLDRVQRMDAAVAPCFPCVSYQALTGAPRRIGKVEDLNKISGVGVLWESGERSWFAYVRLLVPAR